MRFFVHDSTSRVTVSLRADYGKGSGAVQSPLEARFLSVICSLSRRNGTSRPYHLGTKIISQNIFLRSIIEKGYMHRAAYCSLRSDVYIYRHHQKMIAIIPVRPNVVLG
jgi:predicted RNA binding protein YcfA (HicA-like mRNA interferase family)